MDGLRMPLALILAHSIICPACKSPLRITAKTRLLSFVLMLGSLFGTVLLLHWLP